MQTNSVNLRSTLEFKRIKANIMFFLIADIRLSLNLMPCYCHTPTDSGRGWWPEFSFIRYPYTLLGILTQGTLHPIFSDPLPYQVAVIIFIIQMRELKFREVKSPAHCHTANIAELRFNHGH